MGLCEARRTPVRVSSVHLVVCCLQQAVRIGMSVERSDGMGAREMRDPSRRTAATRVTRCCSLLWCEGILYALLCQA